MCQGRSIERVSARGAGRDGRGGPHESGRACEGTRHSGRDARAHGTRQSEHPRRLAALLTGVHAGRSSPSGSWCGPDENRPGPLQRWSGLRTGWIGWRGIVTQKCQCRKVSRKSHIPSDLVVDQWVSNVASSSPHDFLLLHDLWTTFRHLLWSQITSVISMAWDFTTKSGGIWKL